MFLQRVTRAVLVRWRADSSLTPRAGCERHDKQIDEELHSYELFKVTRVQLCFFTILRTALLGRCLVQSSWCHLPILPPLTLILLAAVQRLLTYFCSLLSVLREHLCMASCRPYSAHSQPYGENCTHPFEKKQHDEVIFAAFLQPAHCAQAYDMSIRTCKPLRDGKPCLWHTVYVSASDSSASPRWWSRASSPSRMCFWLSTLQPTLPSTWRGGTSSGGSWPGRSGSCSRGPPAVDQRGASNRRGEQRWGSRLLLW